MNLLGETLIASHIVHNPECVDEIEGRYQLIYDSSINGLKFDNLDEAVCIMGERGWHPVCMTAGERASRLTVIHVLMEKLK